MIYRASKLDLREVPLYEEQAFLNENHHQGYCASRYCYGLYDTKELITLMSFGKPRFNKHYDFELIRLATKKDCRVHGGASRLLKHFREQNKEATIISYCDRDRFDGQVYRALGFQSIGIRNGYHYEKDGIRYSRFYMQSKRCKQRWPEYIDTKKTEREIAFEKGYTRVDDEVGQEVFVLGDTRVRWYIYEIIIADKYHYIGQHYYRVGDDFENDRYYGSGRLLKTHQAKYGRGKKIILYSDIKTSDEANKLEEQEIAKSWQMYGARKDDPNGLNLNILSGAGDTFIRELHHGWTEESRQRQSTYRKGKPGRKHTTEDIEKMRASRIKFLQNETEEQKAVRVAKIKESWKKRDHKRSPETIERISQIKREMHFHHSEETKARISASKMGHEVTDEARAKMSIAKKGKPSWKKGTKVSEEVKANMKKAQTGLHWWTNGVVDTKAKECPQGWWKGRLIKKNLD